MKKFVFFCLTLILSQLPVYSWWDSSHMVIAQIAEERFTKETQAEVDRLIGVLSNSYPGYPDIQTVSVWADDVKSGIFKEYGKWHHQRLPYDPENILTNQQLERINEENKNALQFGLEKCIATLKDKEQNDMERAISLAMIVHLVGDVHMPLNCINRYSKEFPNGDKAGKMISVGNLFETGDNLHNLWDSCLLEGTHKPARPANAKDKAFVTNFAQMIVSEYPENQLAHTKKLDIASWLQEGRTLGESHVYKFTHHQKPSDEYMTKGRKLAHERIALASYRLAHLLNETLHQS